LISASLLSFSLLSLPVRQSIGGFNDQVQKAQHDAA
jgi:hypothetical protein